MKKLLFISCFAFIACANEPIENFNNGEGCLLQTTELDSIEDISDQFNLYLEGFSLNEDPTFEAIQKEMQTLFVAPALVNTQDYFYDESFEYNYGTQEYINTNFVAVTFNLNGDDGYNLLDGTIIATYNVIKGSFIDAEVIGESTTYEYGELRNNECDYSIELMNDNEEIAFEIKCDLTIISYEDRDYNQATSEAYTYTYLVDEFGMINTKEE